ncbi:MAG: EAL domain-containing protein [Rhodospirillales bacterium]|nr:EAL domain-containing protein [Rhodospirillales bacterium]
MPSDAATRDHAPARYRLQPHQRDAATERRRLERDLALAVQQGRLLLHYQPRIVLASGQTRAAEALVRWPHRTRGLVSPTLFIPLAEQSSLILSIGGWVLRAACRQARQWQRPWCVSVNVAARQITSGALLGQVAAALEESGLPPERLELELTESELIDVDAETLLALSAVRDLGVGLALDDFGSGHASLAVLRRLPLTVMKLDRSLLRDVPEHPEDTAVLRAVIALGHALGLSVVAEGIEREPQRAFLSGCGCDEGQGYLFSQPLPPEQLAAQMAK